MFTENSVSTCPGCFCNRRVRNDHVLCKDDAMGDTVQINGTTLRVRNGTELYRKLGRSNSCITITMEKMDYPENVVGTTG